MITWNLTNCTGEIKIVDDVDENFNTIQKEFIEIVPMEGYLLDVNNKIKLVVKSEDVDEDWNPIYVYVDKFIDVDNEDSVTIDKSLYVGSYETLDSVTYSTMVEVPVIGFTITNIMLNNATCNYSNGDMLEKEKPIIITPDEGYIFRDGYYDYPAYLDSNLEIIYFKNDDGSQLYLLETWKEDIELMQSYSPYKKKDPNMSTFTDLYKITNDELKELSKVRWVEGGTSIIDLGQYIANLFILPIKLDDEIVGDLQTIYLGDVDTKVDSTVLKSYELIVNVGEITVPEIYNNVYDYINTRCILHLPYFDKIFINNEYVVNQTLGIEYIINLYTGYATVNITSTFTDTIIESRNSMIVTNIPYMQGKSVIGSYSNNRKNDSDKAYIEIVRNKPYKVTNPFGKSVIEYGKLLDYKGFVQCDNVQLKVKATNKEKDTIISLLNKGVFIND